MTHGISNVTEPSSPGDSSIQARLSCLLEGPSPAQRDHCRAQALSRFDLLSTDAVPVFDEATQTISRLMAMPISILGLMDTDWQRFKSVVGLSNLGLMNPLAQTRRLPRTESFCTHVIDSNKAFILEDATAHPAFSRSLLVQQYGIRAYLGVPLTTTEGCCVGTLAVMDLSPRKFTPQELALLELSARWCMSEFEKQHALSMLERTMLEKDGDRPLLSAATSTTESPLLSEINRIRFDLIVELTQDLRSPLTSITGLANMLSREIYGPLSEKQQEYTEIVLNSSQQLLEMVDEIVEVGDLRENDYQLDITTVDIEMIGQQALSALESVAQQRDLTFKLTVEPGSRIWKLDRRVVRQLLYHLVFSIAKMATAGSTIRLHVSQKDNSISIALWVSNPWLGEDLPLPVIAWSQPTLIEDSVDGLLAHPLDNELEALKPDQNADASRQELGLLLSRHLTEMHGGETIVQGSAATGYRYVITLPSTCAPPLSEDG